MASVVAIDNLKPDKIKRLDGIPNPKLRPNTTFFKESSKDTPIGPFASLVRHDPPGGTTRAHYHEIDEFHVITGGKGKMGRHDVAPYCVHYVRAYTPYGPLRSDREVGWDALTLRTRYTVGGQRFPEFKDALRQMPDRRPWQITKKIDFPGQGPGVTFREIPEIRDEQGLFVHALTMAPHTRTVAPDPSGGDGQFVLVVQGSLIHDHKEHNAMALAFVKPVEAPFEIHAGAQGLEALILNFPRVAPRAKSARTPSVAAGYKKWQCELCDYAYDEALGLPGDGIAAGTRWQDVPESWNCPDCSANKGDFQIIDI